ncbi:PQQ-dependent sugar dehydrogenase [Rhodocytophaga aerolata]|uniref:PQQ-dependent sugar dehydrogenase n=1 Tax=Rhodocytophaga aerolata TaxID=455078 RepID=A0ABT8R7W6_9BACT|nr:PQQ-dependent sugar dehydrogenase [Rhodocytophaga aerolata]MDO1448191.1 PQQ-dependent sugar dehydrogenase [Rhodocytophaga aerolata]
MQISSRKFMTRAVGFSLILASLVSLLFLSDVLTEKQGTRKLRVMVKKLIKKVNTLSPAPPQAIRIPLDSAIHGDVKFEKIALANTTDRHSSLTMGPDGKLYASTVDGRIKRFPVKADGTLGDPQIIYALQDAYGKRTPRLTIGLTFDPAATADSLVAWVTHSSFAFINGPDWDGKLTRLSGPDLQTVQDVLVHLPRSAKDHLTNSIAFGPDGALYFSQGSNSAMGKEDEKWGNRKEHLLSGAILRLDTDKLAMLPALPLDVKTSEGGSYNPYAADAPLTIFASGIRNAYDLLWHSNGQLYVPTNGSNPGGNTPASVAGTRRMDGSVYDGPEVPELMDILQDQHDFLFRVEKGGYYGHPNTERGEFVMNGGNPTDEKDPAELEDYPVGTLPDANWRGFSFQFPLHASPNGIIEYKGNAFNGELKRKILIVRYVNNKDIIVLEPGGSKKDIVKKSEGTSIPGFWGFAVPIDLTEDVRTGNIYVSEFAGDGQISLLRPLCKDTQQIVVHVK